MLPILWPQDVVEIASCSLEDVRPGEIVLALREGRFYLHRFVARRHPAGFLLQGDSLPVSDPPFPDQALLGRLTGRLGTKFASACPPLPLRPWSWAIGRLICHFGPARRLALKLHARRQPPHKIHNADGASLRGTADLGLS
jgi:hypothetical protein